MNFQTICSAVIPSVGQTLDAFQALLRRTNFDGKTKMSKIEKDEEWVGWPSGSLIMSFEVIFCATSKVDYHLIK